VFGAKAFSVQLTVLGVRGSNAEWLVPIVLSEAFQVEWPNAATVIHDTVENKRYVHARIMLLSKPRQFGWNFGESPIHGGHSQC
jgi:hypothetical protein